MAAAKETRHGVPLTNLDQPLFDGADATKRDLVEYLDAVAPYLLPELEQRPLSVVRVHRGQEAFMQKNVPDSAPEWVPRVGIWAEASKREVHYALCDDVRTLTWFANQRAVEYHPALWRVDRPGRVTHMVLDLDPPSADAFAMAVAAAHLVREVLDGCGLGCGVKTSGATGVHVYVPLDDSVAPDDAAAATRAVAARAEQLDPSIATTAFVIDEREGKVFVDSTRALGATVVAAYSPRVRAGAPVSFPVTWDTLDAVSPRDFTIHTVPELLAGGGSTPPGPDAWTTAMGRAQPLPADLVAEGHAIPFARVQAMHAGKRKKRASQTEDG